jgi:hypothetical protein
MYQAFMPNLHDACFVYIGISSEARNTDSYWCIFKGINAGRQCHLSGPGTSRPYLSIAFIIYDNSLDMLTFAIIFLRRCISYSTFLEDVLKEESLKKTKYVSLY